MNLKVLILRIFYKLKKLNLKIYFKIFIYSKMFDRKEYMKQYRKRYRENEENREKIRERDKKYYEQNRDKILEYQKEYAENNKDKIREYKKEYSEENKEKLQEKKKEYYEENKEILIKKQKEYYDNNKEIISVKSKEYHEKNRDKIIEYLKDYYKNNKEILTEKQKVYVIKNKEKIKEYHKEYTEKNKEKIKEYKKCRNCKLFQVQQMPFLCSYCDPNKTPRQKTKENRVKTFLERCNYTFTYNKKCNIDKTCQTYFPDFVIDCNTFFLIIECDENAHSSYPIDCEKIRENNICYALGLPCVFIRYNPDKKKIKIEIKEKVLKSYIEYYKSKEMIEGNEVCYLFY